MDTNASTHKPTRLLIDFQMEYVQNSATMNVALSYVVYLFTDASIRVDRPGWIGNVQLLGTADISR